MPGARALPAIRGDITFRACHLPLSHRRAGNPARRQLRCAGRADVGIVGPSGSGKSTFAKLVQRLYVPESGRVLIDGIDLAMVDPAWLRRQIGVVLQENVLFNRSVRDNIALADPAMPMEQVIAAASSPARTTSSWSCRKATTRSSASAAQRFRAASASASPSPARSSPIRAS